MNRYLNLASPSEFLDNLLVLASQQIIIIAIVSKDWAYRQAILEWAQKRRAKASVKYTLKYSLVRNKRYQGPMLFSMDTLELKEIENQFFKQKNYVKIKNLSQSSTSQILKKLDKQGCFQNVFGSAYKIKYYPLFPFLNYSFIPLGNNSQKRKEEEKERNFLKRNKRDIHQKD
ncbi:hypothetical protein ABPG72_003166 [Tetrahymena utriculariae]